MPAWAGGFYGVGGMWSIVFFVTVLSKPPNLELGGYLAFILAPIYPPAPPPAPPTKNPKIPFWISGLSWFMYIKKAPRSKTPSTKIKII